MILRIKEGIRLALNWYTYFDSDVLGEHGPKGEYLLRGSSQLEMFGFVFLISISCLKGLYTSISIFSNRGIQIQMLGKGDGLIFKIHEIPV